MDAISENALTTPGVRVRLTAEILQILAAILLWLILFAIGIFVDSGPHRTAIQLGDGGLAAQAFHWVAAILAYTLTNVALLSINSAVLGAATRRLENIFLARPMEPAPLSYPYAAAALRGFFVYLMAVSGLIFMVEGLFKSIVTSADAYIRISGGISMVAFLIGYSPELFARILSRLATLLEEHAGRKAPAEAGKPGGSGEPTGLGR